MKFTVLIIMIFFLFSCSDIKNDDLYIEILNDNLCTFDTFSGKDTINIVKYKIVNSTDKKYYINQTYINQIYNNPSIFYKGIDMKIYDFKGKEVKYLPNLKRVDDFELNFRAYQINILEKQCKRLGYNEVLKYFALRDKISNFYIYPNEEKYFEFAVNLSNGIDTEPIEPRIYAEILKDKRYYLYLSMVSDSINNKKHLPNDILMTLKNNNIEVYHGVIKSKNRVPINIIE